MTKTTTKKTGGLHAIKWNRCKVTATDFRFSFGSVGDGDDDDDDDYNSGGGVESQSP